MKRSVMACGVAVALVALGGCGGSGSDKDVEQAFTIKGGLQITAPHQIRISPETQTCEATGDLGDLINPESQGPVAIVDPKGNEIGQLDLNVGIVALKSSKKGKKFTPVPGVCNFAFQGQVKLDPNDKGTFKATVPGLGAETKFKLADAQLVVITWSPEK